MSGALLNVSGLSLHGWQWMFLIEGFASIVLCGFVWFWLQSHPHQAKWLSADEKHALQSAIALEQQAREAAQVTRPSMFKLLADKQIALFCFIYFSIALTIYGATFWLPSMIKKMGNLGDFEVGLFNSIPWLISIVAMYGFAALASQWKHQQAWVALMLVIAAVGMFMSTTGGPVFAFVAICFAAIGFKAASALFWPIPQGYLDARIAAAVIALINSVGNLGGFVAPTTFGLLEQTTGSIEGGLYGLAATSLVAAVVVFFARTTPRGGVPPTIHHALRPGPQGAAS